MRRLAQEASGLRHLRWAREVLGALEAHHEHDPRLDAPARAFVLGAAVDLRAAIERSSAAVKPYRDFLERTRTGMRGMVRVGRSLQRAARSDDEAAEADAIAEGFDEVFRNFEARERVPRKDAVRRAIAALRAHLEAMDASLTARFGAAFVDGLYPDVTADGAAVIDDGDPDDDSTVGPA